jgi:crotonobetaine/carnitine-CoA ligase
MAYHHQAYQYASPLGNHMLVDREVLYPTVPPFHIGGQWAAAYGALLVDGRLVLRERFSVRSFWPDVDRFGVTQTLLLGVMTDFLAKQEPRADDSRHSLRRVAMAPVPLEDRAFSERFNVRINQGWGLTEAGCITARPPGPSRPPTAPRSAHCAPTCTSCGWSTVPIRMCRTAAPARRSCAGGSRS